MSNIIGQIRSILQAEAYHVAEVIKQQHKSAGQVASGRTLASIRAEMIADAEGAHAVVWGRSPFGTLETGRKPGKVPMGFVQIIRQWMADKGISATPIPYVRQPSATWSPKYTPEERGAMSLAGAIAYKIRTEGTSLYRRGGRADIYSNVIGESVERIEKQIGDYLEAEINTIHLNTAKK